MTKKNTTAKKRSRKQKTRAGFLKNYFQNRVKQCGDYIHRLLSPIRQISLPRPSLKPLSRFKSITVPSPKNAVEAVRALPAKVKEQVTQKHSKQRSYFLGVRRAAWIENIVYLSFVTALSYIFADGNRFIDVSPHPFWLILLLMAIQYGTSEALLSAILASAFLLIGNLPEHEISESTYDYVFKVIFKPFLWIVSAVIFGELSGKHIRREQRLETRLHKSEEASDSIAQAYDELKKGKEYLETRVAAELHGSLAMYEAVKVLSQLDKGHILFALDGVVKTIMNPQKFSIYGVGEDGIEPVIASGWDNKEAYLRRFTSDSSLYKEVVDNRRFLCAVNAEDEAVLNGEGLLVGPLVNSENGEIFGILKIEQLAFKQLNISNVQTFQILCQWIGHAYANASKYQAAKANSMMNEQNMLFSEHFFKRQRDFLVVLAEHIGFDLSLIDVQIANRRELSEAENAQTIVVLVDIVRTALHGVKQSFQIFENQQEEARFAIILPGITPAKTKSLMNKIQKGIKKEQHKIAQQAQCEFEIQSLHKKTRRRRRIAR